MLLLIHWSAFDGWKQVLAAVLFETMLAILRGEEEVIGIKAINLHILLRVSLDDERCSKLVLLLILFLIPWT